MTTMGPQMIPHVSGEIVDQLLRVAQISPSDVWGGGTLISRREGLTCFKCSAKLIFHVFIHFHVFPLVINPPLRYYFKICLCVIFFPDVLTLSFFPHLWGTGGTKSVTTHREGAFNHPSPKTKAEREETFQFPPPPRGKLAEGHHQPRQRVRETGVDFRQPPEKGSLSFLDSFFGSPLGQLGHSLRSIICSSFNIQARV